jgi:hypothetical protein
LKVGENPHGDQDDHAEDEADNELANELGIQGIFLVHALRPL